MRKQRKFLLLIFLGAVTILWLNNTSLFKDSAGPPTLIAHRGLAPEMDPEHEDYRACLARIREADHDYIENTIPSIQAAFDLDATFVEIDVRRTADNRFVVFHDDVLDCKTEGTGFVADHSMDDLRALDVGFGYFTRDGRHPLRGRGTGLMSTLDEVLDRFPTRNFVINVKDNLGPLAEAFAKIVEAQETSGSRQLIIFSGNETRNALRSFNPKLRVVSRESAKSCIRDYMLTGWTGYVPATCQNTATGMYANYAWALWGWPHRFVERMERVGTIVILTHPYQTESIHDLPETSDYARLIPDGYSGAVVTNRIDKIKEWMSDTR